MSGQTVPTQQGSISLESVVGLTGNNADTAVGLLTVDNQKVLTGQVVTITAGDIGISKGEYLTVPMSSLTVATEYGPIGLANTISVTGQSVSIQQGTIDILIVSSNLMLELTGLTVETSVGSILHERSSQIPSNTVTVTNGLLIRAQNCSLDYVESGYIDDGYTCDTIVLSDSAIQEIVTAIWSHQLPVTGTPTTSADIVARAVWTRSLPL